jgi:hypothetical protein
MLPPRRVDRLPGLGRSALALLVLLSHCSPERRVLASDSSGVGGSPDQTVNQGVAGTGGSATTDDPSAAGGSSTAAGGSSTAGVADACGNVTCPASCDHGFELMVHKHAGCLVCECAPVNDCSSDTDCASGTVCYTGVQCDDACTTPDCCSGNHCGLPGCPPPSNVTCLTVGCANGDVCLAQCDSATCLCDGTQWTCTYEGGTLATCASACAVP